MSVYVSTHVKGDSIVEYRCLIAKETNVQRIPKNHLQITLLCVSLLGSREIRAVRDPHALSFPSASVMTMGVVVSTGRPLQNCLLRTGFTDDVCERVLYVCRTGFTDDVCERVLYVCRTGFSYDDCERVRYVSRTGFSYDDCERVRYVCRTGFSHDVCNRVLYVCRTGFTDDVCERVLYV
ncbi:hypothetical protein RRG08_036153 [Elysia crispata]|uniref:Uncharacterized protein n=1 Tax=Elysia crispata TaxID=231223 RepID=A0AAE1CEY6_9GAST|nr:hypothetical protein RRG08_036153 [Elysia crispata]